MRWNLSEAWRQGWRLWVPALVFFALNLGVFVTYRALFADEAAVRRAQLDRATEELRSMRAEQADLDLMLERIEGSQGGISQLYKVGFSTERDRLTTLIREVKGLAKSVGMSPQTIRYPHSPLEDFGLSKRSFVFSVEGTYYDLRNLVNLLELSDYFLALEEVALGESGGRGGGGRLKIDLTISTLFADEVSPRTGSRTGPR